jgi:NAD(P)-dependent dehydrogenase (short-subunit alcohol dehydrogenase family)
VLLVQVAVYCLTMDMTDLPAVAKTLEHLPDDFKPVDILINNAGLALGTAFSAISLGAAAGYRSHIWEPPCPWNHIQDNVERGAL